MVQCANENAKNGGNRMKNIIVKITAALALVVLGGWGAALAQERVRPGIYEVSIDGTVAASRCYSPAEVKSMNLDSKSMQAWAEKQAAEKKCTVSGFKISGNTVTMTETCGARTATTVATYSSDSFDLVITAVNDKGTTTTHVKARRTGDCK
jgi:hypothetical protein